jgi:hypothetical protein
MAALYQIAYEEIGHLPFFRGDTAAQFRAGFSPGPRYLNNMNAEFP